MSPQGFPRGPVVKNLPSNAGDVGSITSQGAKIPCVNKATKPVHHNRDPAQSKKLKSNKYTNIFSNRRANTRREESEPHSENPGRTYTQGHLLNHQGRQLGSLCVSKKNRHHELKHNQSVKVCELLMKLCQSCLELHSHTRCPLGTWAPGHRPGSSVFGSLSWVTHWPQVPH